MVKKERTTESGGEREREREREREGALKQCQPKSPMSVVLLVMLRLYCPMGSEMAPEIAGPMMNPIPHDVEIIETPRLWVESSDSSETTALPVPTIPREQ